jgi:signal peptidase complex subunit 2
VENHLHTDVKLFLGYLSAAISIGEFAYTWKRDFQEFKHITIASVVGYFVISTLLTFWHLLVEKDVVFVGTNDNEKIKVTGCVAGTYTDKYILRIDRAGTKGDRSDTMEASFGDWFDVDGVLVRPALEQKLKVMLG